MLGDGRIPDELRSQLAAKGMRLDAEELPGSITYRNYRAPGRRSSLRKEATTGAIAITGARLVVWTGSSKHIDVPLTHPLRAAISVATDGPDKICLAYDANAFDPRPSGRVEVRLRTPHAAQIVALLGSAPEA